MWLTAEPIDDKMIELRWGTAAGPREPYCVSNAQLTFAANKIRQALNALAVWNRNPDQDQLPELMTKLAKAGKQLRSVLFPKRPEAEKAQKSLETAIARGDRTLAITVTKDFHIPWGLIFDGDPATVTTLDGRFWCLKHDLSVNFSAHGLEEWHVPRSELSVVSAVSADVYLRDVEPAFERWNSLPEGIAFNREAWEEKAARIQGKEALLHFFCHMSEATLHLDEPMDVLDFQLTLEELYEATDSPSGLVFLNACETAVAGELDLNFRSAAKQHGICGVIATEAKVPRQFAALFGDRLLELLVNQKKTIGETMQTLRRDEALWPLSLLYACYAPPSYRLVSP